MVKLPAVGFMQAMYWQLWMSFRISLLRSYLDKTRLVYTGFVDSAKFYKQITRVAL